MNKRTNILIAVNERAQRFYDKSQAMGTLAAKTFLEEVQGDHRQRPPSSEQQKREMQKHRSQLTGLENIAETTLKVSDVLDYIKKQTARQKAWRDVHAGKRFGVDLKKYIEEDMLDDVGFICAELKIGNDTLEDWRDRQYIHLQLVRQFVRQLLVQYEYHAEELQHAQ